MIVQRSVYALCVMITCKRLESRISPLSPPRLSWFFVIINLDAWQRFPAAPESCFVFCERCLRDFSQGVFCSLQFLSFIFSCIVLALVLSNSRCQVRALQHLPGCVQSIIHFAIRPVNISCVWLCFLRRVIKE